MSQPDRISRTSSGKPDVLVNSLDVDAMKGQLIGDAVNYGYQIEKDTPYLVELSRAANGSENMVASLSIGNGYSTNRRILT